MLVLLPRLLLAARSAFWRILLHGQGFLCSSREEQLCSRLDVLLLTRLRAIKQQELAGVCLVVHQVDSHLVDQRCVVKGIGRLHDVLFHLDVELGESPGGIKVDLEREFCRTGRALGSLAMSLLDLHSDEQL